jgi:hypothetical protein
MIFLVTYRTWRDDSQYRIRVEAPVASDALAQVAGHPDTSRVLAVEPETRVSTLTQMFDNDAQSL